MAKNGVQSVTRALALLRALARSDAGAGVSVLARECDLPISTTHRLLTTLETDGFALFDANTRKWHVGREAFSTGLAFGRGHALAAAALPHLRYLRDLTRETANVGVMRDGRLVTLGQMESREIMRAIATPGGAGVSATASGMGKAILATWPEAAVRELVAQHGLPPLTPRTHRRLNTLLEDLATCRARGWALDDEEHAMGLRCIAAAIYDASGEAVGAISISGLTLRLPKEWLDVVGASVAEAAARLSLQLADGSDPASPGSPGKANGKGAIGL